MTGLIMGICAMLLPLIRELLCVPGLVISIMGLKSEKRAAAIVGIVASAIALVLAAVILAALFHVYRLRGPHRIFLQHLRRHLQPDQRHDGQDGHRNDLRVTGLHG